MKYKNNNSTILSHGNFDHLNAPILTFTNLRNTDYYYGHGTCQQEVSILRFYCMQWLQKLTEVVIIVEPQ